MSRQLPVPSPGPRWEALKEPSHPSSSDEESGDENTAASVTLNAHRPQQPLKRKDNDRSSAFASVAKRPRHELEREGHGSTGGSASAPGPSSSSRPSSAQAGPSRIPNHRPSASLTGISAGPSRTQSSSSGTRKGDTSQEVSTVPRPRPKPRPQHISVFSNPERDDYDKSSSKKNGKSVVEQRHFSGSSSKGKKPASQATKPKFISNEIIEISSGSESDPPPRITFKPKSPSRSSKSNNKADIPPRAKKTSGNGNKGNKPQSSSKRTGSPEIIVISDSSDEEVNKAPVRTSQPVKTAGPSKQESEKRLPTPPPSHNMPKSRDSDIAMDVDNEVGASVADMEVDQVENIPPPMVAEPVPPLTPSPDIAPIPEVVAPVSAPKPATPPRPLTPSPRKPPTPEKIVPSASPSTSTQPSVSRMSSGSHSPARKPTLKRPSVNLLPAPPLDADVPPPPPKRKLQSGIKTASVTRRMSSSSSGDDSGSERSQLATGSREASSAPEEGIDMRDVSDALDVAFTMALRAAEHTTQANAQLSQSSEPHRTSVPGAIQLARKSTGGVGPRPKEQLAARNSIGGEGTPSFTLAEAIMNAGKLNASYKHRKGVSIDSASSSSLSSERKKVAASNPLLQHAKASASKIYSKSPLVAYEQASKLGFSSASSFLQSQFVHHLDRIPTNCSFAHQSQPLLLCHLLP
ncbi:hypothetical protein BDN70DRAFT_385863 [Pholiota conissans]|uniref:Uncharacterized protein n=1 Tax=Pholiota conissans TaxID=109636 RepID=A0A9P5YQR5_9AGAR|nr:hypothetical protein BDN70DRAFT_385863 [Pholiota conissans]